MSDKVFARPSSLEMLHEAALAMRYIAPAGHTLEMVMAPDYFKNNARECKHSRVPGRNPWNRIEVIADDGTWEADLRIVSVSEHGHVEMRLLRHWELPAKVGRKPTLPGGYKVEHVHEQGWRAIDRNGDVIASKLSNEGKALDAAIEHNRKAMAGAS